MLEESHIVDALLELLSGRPCTLPSSREREANMYEPSRQLMSFNVAGFQFWDGALVLGELRAGR